MSTKPDEGAGAGGGHVRATHADRDHVVEVLAVAFVAGRLTKDELEVRVGQALTARTYAELAVLTADIPAGPPISRLSHRAARRRSAPARTPGARNAAAISAACLVAAFLSFCGAVRLDDSATKVVFGLTLLFILMAFMFAAGAVVELRRSSSRLPPGPGQGGQQGGDTAIGPSPLGPRTDQTRTDIRSRNVRGTTRVRAVPAPTAA